MQEIDVYRGMKIFWRVENYVFALRFGEEINKSNDVAVWLISNEVYLKFILINLLQLKEVEDNFNKLNKW